MKTPSPAAPSPCALARPRGRPREFDRDAALDCAMALFWAKGYEAASIAELTGAMGINPPSLYAAFGDKDRLFLAAIERYEAAGGENFRDWDAEPTARAAVARLLRYLAGSFSRSAQGCMMLMAAATSANASPRLRKALAAKRAAARARLRARIRRGMAEGDVPPGTDAAALADFYATIIAGMSQQARDGASRGALLATVERALQLFPSAPARRSARRTPASRPLPR
jgi:AcrR family transcriptional regulator